MAPSSKTKRGDLTRVLVVGGNGFLGHHIVNQLVNDWNTSHVSAIDLRCEKNRNDACHYRECDITNDDALLSAFEDLKPEVVIHTASPAAVDHTNSNELFKKVNVGGTEAIIRACQKTGVKALVYTSSASVISNDVDPLLNADERWPVLRGDQQNSYYSETKAAAEEAVLKANRADDTKFLTCAIRPAGIFGEADGQTIAGFLNAYNNNKHKVQIGDNSNLFDFTYVGNVAHAHLLAARLLLATHAANTVPLDHERVDGEAFLVTNDSPVYFWDFARAVWAAAGDKSGTQGTWHLGEGLGGALGVMSEIFGSIVGKEMTFNKKKVTMTCMTRYFNIAKARRVLRYEPLWSLSEGVERSVNWFLDQGKVKKQ